MSERDEILLDLAERARFFASLTTIGFLPPGLSPSPALSAANATVLQPVAGLDARSPADLEAVRHDLGDCQRCKLAKTRKTIVFGQGNPRAALMFVGEAPGADEDEQGLAFVGKAGQLLTRIIEAMGMKREDVFIANILKCLRYNTTVQLEDGSWERIGRLVARRYSGNVMSVDAQGRVVAKKVVGWYRSPLSDRPVYKLSYASSAVRGGNRAVTWLTGDHEVLTRRGWVAAAELQPADEVAVGIGLSQVASDVITGSLLGDATIPRNNAHLTVSHCRRQEGYLRLKAHALQELHPVISLSEVTASKGGPRHPIVTCRTRASRALQPVRARFYEGRKKHVPRDLRLNARALAVWFLDDGYTRVREGRTALSEIAAHSFVGDGLPHLVEMLGRDLGIAAHVRESSPGRIQFGADASRRLSEAVAPFCPPGLRYKLHPGVRDRVPFSPGLYEPGPPLTVFDRVVAQRVEFKGADKTFFCIDVEDTHNFVTSGGVVHNCRPPQNRNPEPDEVLSCHPFLEKQIAVVRPKVIVGLGKFGAQWLLKTAEPITRLRGRLGQFQGITVMPTYHPAYLLRNPGAKKEVWEDMKVVREILGRA